MWGLSTAYSTLVPRPGIEPIPAVMEGQGLNHQRSPHMPLLFARANFRPVILIPTLASSHLLSFFTREAEKENG